MFEGDEKKWRSCTTLGYVGRRGPCLVGNSLSSQQPRLYPPPPVYALQVSNSIKTLKLNLKHAPPRASRVPSRSPEFCVGTLHGAAIELANNLTLATGGRIGAAFCSSPLLSSAYRNEHNCDSQAFFFQFYFASNRLECINDEREGKEEGVMTRLDREV